VSSCSQALVGHAKALAGQVSSLERPHPGRNRTHLQRRVRLNTSWNRT
jgi:hypothetical protein